MQRLHTLLLCWRLWTSCTHTQHTVVTCSTTLEKVDYRDLAVSGSTLKAEAMSHAPWGTLLLSLEQDITLYTKVLHSCCVKRFSVGRKRQEDVDLMFETRDYCFILGKCSYAEMVDPAAVPNMPSSKIPTPYNITPPQIEILTVRLRKELAFIFVVNGM